MLELQRIALRGRLQVVVTTHSPVVLDSVPSEARLFLDRDEQSYGVGLVQPAHRDLLQKALYGEARDKLSILCEDRVAEQVIRGALDVLSPEMALRPDDFVIGTDTGAEEFPSHVRALGKVERLRDTLFILDADASSMRPKLAEAGETFGYREGQTLFLPGGDGPPERWLWSALRDRSDRHAEALGVSERDLQARMDEIERLVEGAVRQANRDKVMWRELERTLHRRQIARTVAKGQVEAGSPDTAEFVTRLSDGIGYWRRVRKAD